jgi:multiple sugar transport system permease protein
MSKNTIKLNLSFDRTSLIGMLLILPIIIWMILSVIYPVISAISMSFTDINFFGTKINYTGFKNYIFVLKNPEFWNAFLKSIIWAIGNSIVQLVLGLGSALLLKQNIKGKKFFRVLIILPWILPTIAVAIIWRWILNSDFGILNYVLQLFHFTDKPIVFLGSLKTAMPTVIFINSWRWFPFFSIIILAALMDIPKYFYEVADIEGGNTFQKFKHITFPMLKPLLSVTGVVGTLWSINIFDIIWMLTSGGPVNATKTLPVYIYRKVFQDFEINIGVTAAVIFALFLITYVIILVKVDSTLNGKENKII